MKHKRKNIRKIRRFNLLDSWGCPKSLKIYYNTKKQKRLQHITSSY